jgi:predicted Rossmann fold flavoprotein
VEQANKIIVIGAGAAGLLAAGRAAQLGASVLVIEKMRQPGRKLLLTGKGRCNITNDAPEPEFYKHIFPRPKFLKHAFGEFFKDDIIHLLNSHGTATVVERGSRIFPTSDKSFDVLKALMAWIGKLPVEFLFETTAREILIENGSVSAVKVFSGNKTEIIPCDKIILCTGGKSYPGTGSTGDGYRFAKQLGHKVVEQLPALVGLETSGHLAPALAGLKLKNCNAVVWSNGKKIAEEFGEIYIEEYGLDGPAILTLSRKVIEELRNGSKIEISIDLKPALNEEKLDARLIRDIEAEGKKQVETLMRSWMPMQLIPVFLSELKLDGKKLVNQLTGKERRAIMLLLKNLRFEISGDRGFDEAIITAGGIDTTEIDGKTMESKLVKNLYFAGEVIDLDANTGGYNLQIAFSTGWLAGQASMVKKND